MKHTFRDDNSALVWVLPYPTAEYQNNQKAYHAYYDEIEICPESSQTHYKSAFQVRNRRMADRSDLVVCCIQKKSGGAYRAVRYAAGKGKRIINIAEDL